MPAQVNDTAVQLVTGGLEFVINDDIKMLSEVLFISREEIRVVYEFQNNTDTDQKVLVAFPMPDIEPDWWSPTAFPDGIGEAWWLALEEIIAREQRIHLMIDRQECRFATGSTPEKYVTFEFLASWLRTLPPADLSFAIHDLCKRCSVDLAALSRDASMDWDDLAKLAADPLVTIGSATVNYFALSNLKDADARREMNMGKAVAETALHRPIGHLAYPFGDPKSWRRAHVAMAQEAGYASAQSLD